MKKEEKEREEEDGEEEEEEVEEEDEEEEEREAGKVRKMRRLKHLNVIFLVGFFFFFFVFLAFLGPYLWHMKVPRLGVQSELQPPAYTRATATSDLSLVCDLHHSSRQRWILNPLRKARNGIHNLMVSSWIC